MFPVGLLNEIYKPLATQYGPKRLHAAPNSKFLLLVVVDSCRIDDGGDGRPKSGGDECCWQRGRILVFGTTSQTEVATDKN